MRGQACTLPDKKGNPDRLDWQLAGNAIGMEVCLFKAAAVLENRNALIRVLRNSGFGEPYVVHQPATVTWFVGIQGDGEVITASVPIRELPAGFGGFFEKLFAYGFGVGVTIDKFGRPFDTSATYSRK